MGTFLDLRTNIASDLTRDDLSDQIKRAVLDAVRLHAASRFWFNTTRTKTFATVADQTNYGAAALAEIPNIIQLDKLFLFDGASRYPLEFFEVADFEMAAVSGAKGRPTIYTRTDGEILLYPIPNAVWTLRPHMHYRLAKLSADGDANAWTDEDAAEMLIRAQAKWFLYTNLIEDDEGASRMLPQIVDYKARLDAETSKRTASGVIRGTDF